MRIIEREIYLNKIKPFIGKNLIKVITGQRRTGKSYFLKQIMNIISKQSPNTQIIYINKEDFAFDNIRTYVDLINYVEQNKQSNDIALFIDEIQDIEQFEKALRHFHTKEIYDIYCTGSNASLLSSDLATLLSGRSIEMQIFALSYPEFLQFHALPDNDESFEKYLVFGGMPNLVNLSLQEHVVFEYLSNIYNTIIVRDVIEKHKIRNTVFLRNLSTYLADNVGSLVSSKKISDFLKSQQINISVATVNEYLSFLLDTYFLFQVKRSDLQGKKIFEINEKYYFNDIGLRNSLIGFKAADIGKLMENIVFNHLKIAGYKVFVGYDRYKEIDFVAEKNNELLYIQVTYLLKDEQTVRREFGNLMKIRNSYPKFVVSMDITSKNTYQGIKHIHIRDFCKMILKK